MSNHEPVVAAEERPSIVAHGESKQPREESGCCAAAEQTSCCEPAAKAGCCGASADGGCGCR